MCMLPGRQGGVFYACLLMARIPSRMRPFLPNNQSEEFENPMIIQTSDDDILEVVEELSEE